jgi:hypothetical protein
MDTHKKAAGRAPDGLDLSGRNCHADSITLARLIGTEASSAVVPIRSALGGRAWRRRRGLQSLSDLAAEYRARRFVREPGLLAPLPEDTLPRWREVQR